MSEQHEATRVVPQWIGIVGLFIAPTTVITSLCYYYGYVATHKYFAYFGIDTDAIGFTTGDYVTKSVRALYVPIVAGLLTYMALLWAGDCLRRVVRSGRHPHLVRRLGWAAVVAGALSTSWAVISLTRPDWALVHVDPLTPVALGLGGVLLGVGLWTLTSSQSANAPQPLTAARASLVVAGAAVVLALFWITGIFAVAYGEGQAAITYAGLWSQPNSVTLDADARLYLPVPPKQIKVTWAPPADSAAKPTFLRYECFRSLAVHGDRWVLVPARWSPEDGYAVIITADSSHVISINMVKNIDDTEAAKRRDGGWACPEVGPNGTTN